MKVIYILPFKKGFVKYKTLLTSTLAFIFLCTSSASHLVVIICCIVSFWRAKTLKISRPMYLEHWSTQCHNRTQAWPVLWFGRQWLSFPTI